MCLDLSSNSYSAITDAKHSIYKTIKEQLTNPPWFAKKSLRGNCVLFLMSISIVQSGWMGLKVDINHLEETDRERDLFDCSICPTVCNPDFLLIFYFCCCCCCLILFSRLIDLHQWLGKSSVWP